MNTDLLHDVRKRLTEFKFKENGAWLRQGVCPNCHKRELYTYADSPWVLRCGRLNKCGYEAHIKEIYPDLFENWSKRYSAEITKNPNAAADAYLSYGRGFDLNLIKGSYSQESYFDSKLGIGSATVRFTFGDTYWERLIDQPQRFGKKKAYIKYGSKYFGQWWQLPGMDFTDAKEIWITEGIFDAIALMHHGVKAVSSISCSNYPGQALESLKQQLGNKPLPKIVFALDGDAAGRKYIIKHVKQARADGWVATGAFIPQRGNKKLDWNDLHQLDLRRSDDTERLADGGLDEYRYHGKLLLAESALDKAMLMYGHNPKVAQFQFEFGKRLYWFELNVENYHKALNRIEEECPTLSFVEQREQAMQESGGIRQIANCYPYPLYYQANRLTDESWYYFKVEFPHDGPAVKNTFTSAQLSGANEFKKRLLAIAPGAMYSGRNDHLDRALERQLYNIKQVETVDFTGYSKEHACYVLGQIAVSNGKIYELNDEDYFDIGRLSVKSLSQSASLNINNDRNDYDKKWVNDLWAAFGAKGLVALTFWFGSLFSEQIRASQKSFPFLEIVGEAGSGKTTLIEFLWKLFGRADYEGFDPSKSTAAGRARNFAQVSGMPVVLIESDREQGADKKTKSFDWDELKTAYNGRSVRSRGVANGGNETYEPAFRGAIVISQNNQVQASDAVMTRIMHLYFDRSTQTTESRIAAKNLEQAAISAVSGFILAATCRETQIMAKVDEMSNYYERQLLQNTEIRTVRIAKCHGQLMALADALQMVIRLSDEQQKALKQQILEMATEREQAIDADHPIVADFWDMYDYLNGDDEKPLLNHARSPQEIAVNLNHFIQVAVDHRQQVPPLRELKGLLKSSKRHRYLGQRVVNSQIKSRDLMATSTSERCWVFERGLEV